MPPKPAQRENHKIIFFPVPVSGQTPFTGGGGGSALLWNCLSKRASFFSPSSLRAVARKCVSLRSPFWLLGLTSASSNVTGRIQPFCGIVFQSVLLFFTFFLPCTLWRVSVFRFGRLFGFWGLPRQVQMPHRCELSCPVSSIPVFLCALRQCNIMFESAGALSIARASGCYQSVGPASAAKESNATPDMSAGLRRLVGKFFD